MSGADYTTQAEPVARALLGEPNAKLSNASDIRFGTHGSVSVDLNKGTWFDHENEIGGGVLDLIVRHGEAADRRAAAEWLQRNGFVNGTRAHTEPPAAHPQLGKPSARWIYTDRAGNPVLGVYRFETGEGKTIRQATPTADAWQWKSLPKGAARPLYNAAALRADDGPVLIVEGEKARDAAAEALPDVFVTCWPGGTSHAGNVDLSPLKGRDVILWPDADDAGRKAMETVAETLHGIASSVRVVDVSELPDTADAADVDERTAARLVANAQSDTRADCEGGEPFDLSTATVGDLIETPPPKRAWLIHEHLPLGTVGILAAAGGTGKSFATLQLGVSAAAGLPWLGMNVDHEGSVLIVSAEDDRDEVHRRLHTVLGEYREAIRQPFEPYADKLRERLHVLDRVGDDNRMTAKVDREAIRTGFADRVIATAAQLPGPVLIVLDPLARFDGGEPNDNADGTRLIECAEHIRKYTGATVLVPHHVSKAAIRDEGSGQEGVRGASGLVDGARWVGMLATMKAETAKRYGIDEESAPFYVRYTRPKANGAPPWSGMWLCRKRGGVLVPVELQEQADEMKQKRSDVEYGELVRRIRDLIARHGPMSKRRIEDHYGGTTNVLKAGQRKVRDTITRALDEGALVTRTCPESRADLIADPKAKEAQE